MFRAKTNLYRAHRDCKTFSTAYQMVEDQFQAFIKHGRNLNLHSITCLPQLHGPRMTRAWKELGLVLRIFTCVVLLSIIFYSIFETFHEIGTNWAGQTIASLTIHAMFLVIASLLLFTPSVDMVYVFHQWCKRARFVIPHRLQILCVRPHVCPPVSLPRVPARPRDHSISVYVRATPLRRHTHRFLVCLDFYLFTAALTRSRIKAAYPPMFRLKQGVWLARCVFATGQCANKFKGKLELHFRQINAVIDSRACHSFLLFFLGLTTAIYWFLNRDWRTFALWSGVPARIRVRVVP